MGFGWWKEAFPCSLAHAELKKGGVCNEQPELADRGLQGSRDEEQSSQRGGGEDGLMPSPWAQALQEHGGE